MSERSAPSYAALRARNARLEYDAWALRYTALCAQRDAGCLNVSDFIAALRDLGFAWDDISAELRAQRRGA